MNGLTSFLQYLNFLIYGLLYLILSFFILLIYAALHVFRYARTLAVAYPSRPPRSSSSHRFPHSHHLLHCFPRILLFSNSTAPPPPPPPPPPALLAAPQQLSSTCSHDFTHKRAGTRTHTFFTSLPHFPISSFPHFVRFSTGISFVIISLNHLLYSDSYPFIPVSLLSLSVLLEIFIPFCSFPFLPPVSAFLPFPFQRRSFSFLHFRQEFPRYFAPLSSSQLLFIAPSSSFRPCPQLILFPSLPLLPCTSAFSSPPPGSIWYSFSAFLPPFSSYTTPISPPHIPSPSTSMCQTATSSYPNLSQMLFSLFPILLSSLSLLSSSCPLCAHPVLHFSWTLSPNT